MNIPNYLTFYLQTIKDYDFSFVRIIVNEKEMPVEELKNNEGYKEKYRRTPLFSCVSNEIIRLKNKNVNLELIYSMEDYKRQIYFIHDLNKNSLIITENFSIDEDESFFRKYFSILIRTSKEKFYNLMELNQ